MQSARFSFLGRRSNIIGLIFHPEATEKKTTNFLVSPIVSHGYVTSNCSILHVLVWLTQTRYIKINDSVFLALEQVLTVERSVWRPPSQPKEQIHQRIWKCEKKSFFCSRHREILLHFRFNIRSHEIFSIEIYLLVVLMIDLAVKTDRKSLEENRK